MDLMCVCVAKEFVFSKDFSCQLYINIISNTFLSVLTCAVLTFVQQLFWACFNHFLLLNAKQDLF